MRGDKTPLIIWFFPANYLVEPKQQVNFMRIISINHSDYSVQKYIYGTTGNGYEDIAQFIFDTTFKRYFLKIPKSLDDKEFNLLLSYLNKLNNNRE